jgi:hypothetical protein
MAHFMPDLPGFAGQLATPRHGLIPLETLSLGFFARTAPIGGPRAKRLRDL